MRYRYVWLLWLVATLVAGAGCDRSPPSPGAAGQGAERAPATAPLPPAPGPGAAVPAQPVPAEAPVVLFLGDSLTAGYGLRESESYPALLQQRLREAGYPHRVVNAGVSGDTSRGGLGRTDWLLGQAPHILVVALGANDGLRGQQPQETRANLAAIIEKGQAAGARVVLAGMRLPRNLGPDFIRRFEAIFPALAKKYGLPFVPFLLEGVAMRRDLNLPDGIHPNPEGAKIVAENVWQVLEPLLRK